MDFDHLLDQAVEMLQRRGPLQYRSRKRQFQLDEEALKDLSARRIGIIAAAVFILALSGCASFQPVSINDVRFRDRTQAINQK